MANAYDLADLVRTQGIWTDAAGDAFDPSDVTVTIKAPDGVQTDYVYGTDAEVVKDATGIYYLDVDANAAGVWHYRYRSTAGGQASDEAWFYVPHGSAFD